MPTTTYPESAVAERVSSGEPAPLRSQLDPGRGSPTTARWGAALAGAFIAAALWLLLYLIGTGIGLAAVDPNRPSTLRAIGIGTGLWTLLAPLIALFLGGLVAGRLAPSPHKGVRAIHGALVWALTTLTMTGMIALLISRLLAGAVHVTTNVAGAAAGAAGQVAGKMNQGSLQELGVQPDDLLGPLNARLRAQGKPEMSANQFNAVMRESLSSSVRTGTLDREGFVRSLESNAGMSHEDAQDVARQVDEHWQQAKQRTGEVAERAQTAGMQAADAAGKAMLWLAVASLLGLAAAMAGALIPGRHGGSMRRGDFGRGERDDGREFRDSGTREVREYRTRESGTYRTTTDETLPSREVRDVDVRDVRVRRDPRSDD